MRSIGAETQGGIRAGIAETVSFVSATKAILRFEVPRFVNAVAMRALLSIEDQKPLRAFARGVGVRRPG
jgi:hypothetical protein